MNEEAVREAALQHHFEDRHRGTFEECDDDLCIAVRKEPK